MMNKHLVLKPGKKNKTNLYMSVKFVSTVRSIFCSQLLLIAFTVDIELGVYKEKDCTGGELGKSLQSTPS